MFLQKLELFGFKSFAQRTQLRFSPGITAVVGPNGCGKSNISDAIRWALGEQNVRNLRGQQLEDVIFKGTREAKPMGMAEVVLHLDNHEQRLATEFAEVTIQRRAFRSGESDFRINKGACRLKDIRDLFLDTGLGSSEYAVIEREMIDEVLADRDQARRFLLDEAAGITRYKQRRKETLRKIEAVEADLVRVDDALEIEEREIRALAYQMGRARRYQRLSDRIRGLDVALARREWGELAAVASGESNRLGTEERERETLRAAGHRLEADQESQRLDLIELSRQLEAAQTRLDEVAGRLASAREETLVRRERLRALGERAVDLETRIAALRRAGEESSAARAAGMQTVERLDAELITLREHAEQAARAWEGVDDELKAARRELAEHQQLQIDQVRRRSESEQRLVALQARRADLDTRAAKLTREHEAFAQQARDLASEIARLTARRAQLAEEESGRETCRTELGQTAAAGGAEATAAAQRQTELTSGIARLESRLHLLEEQARTHAGCRESVAQLLEHRAEIPGLIGVAAELVTIPPEWVVRLGGALREMTEWVVTETEEAAWNAIRWLRARHLGQVTFFPLDMQPHAPSASETAPALPADAVCARDAAWAPLADYLRALFVPVADRAQVPPIAQRPSGRRWILPTGEVCASAGWISAGSGGADEARVWRRPEEIAELGAELREQAAECERVTQMRAAAEQRMREAEERRAQLDSESRECRAAIENLARALAQREAEQRLIAGEMARLVEEDGEVRARHGAFAEEHDHLQREQERTATEGDTGDERLRAAAARVEELGARKDEFGKVLTERRMEQLWGETRLRDARAVLEQHDAAIADAAERVAAMEAELAGAREESQASQLRLEVLGTEEAELTRLKSARGEEGDRLAQERTRREDALAAIEQQLRVKRRALSELEDTLRENEVRLARVEAEKERLRDRIREQHGIDLSAPAAEEAAGDPLAELTPEQAAERLQTLRRERERLGPVNVLAIEEYGRKREHVQFIKTQRDDLVKSRESLLAAIDRINRDARRLFSETFAQVQEHFATTFGTLFPGGEARLELAGEDPLEGDIDIMARPRGKRLESIRLLSSGERALTATALLFGIYLVKPSPFCVLDELDAPLDDANIDRFLTLLRTFSSKTQFIVITHNKRTMEVADSLYGVTMQEPGISKIVSVRLEGGEIRSEDRATTDALLGMLAGT